MMKRGDRCPYSRQYLNRRSRSGSFARQNKNQSPTMFAGDSSHSSRDNLSSNSMTAFSAPVKFLFRIKGGIFG